MVVNITNYRKLWEQHYGPIPKESNGRSYEIHHKDGNHANNDINNLECITLSEHYRIHELRGDTGACRIMAVKMNMSPEEKSKLCSLSNKERINNGTHHFMGEQGSKRATEHNLKMVKEGTHPWLNGVVQNKRVKERTHHFLGPDINQKRLKDGTHNFIKEYICNKCGKIGKGPQMKRFHFNNCKYRKDI